MITSRHDTNRAKQVRAASDAIFSALMDVEISVALDALARVLEEQESLEKSGAAARLGQMKP